MNAIVAEPSSSWDLGPERYIAHPDEVLAMGSRIGKAFSFHASNILVTKTMLGVFGCVPAFDRYFTEGFGRSDFRESALTDLGKFNDENFAEINAQQVFTFDSSTGIPTQRRYPAAKILDMVFVQEGLNRLRRSTLAKSPDRTRESET